jgi:O-antigen ligase
MIVGFCIPVAASVVSIATGDLKAVQYVSYWTALPRWQGAYVNSHNLGHSMSLLLMILALYTHRGTVEREKDAKGSRAFEVSLIALLAVAALYCLYQSQVRTALLGLAVFGAIFLYHENRRLLLILGTSLLVIALATATYWIPALIPEVSMVQRGIEIDALDLGSGRGRFWLNDILVYGELPIDQQLAGVGIGARGQSLDGGEMLYGHSDWLEILTQTGLIGLSLFSVLQILILRAILKMRGGQRFGFLAMFLAVNFMMASSNSYAWRIQVSQLYYMLLAFIELRNVQDRRENDGSQERSRELELDGPHRSASRSPVAPVSFNLQTTDMRLRSADGGSKRCLA